MLRIEPEAYLLGALMILILPLDWLGAAVTAAAVHELCHLGTVVALKGRVEAMRIGGHGATIQANLPGRWEELVSILAGPAGSLFLMIGRHRFPKVALCAMVQGIFNLLPVYPLDGGRALGCILAWVCPERMELGMAMAKGAVAILLTILAAGIIGAFGSAAIPPLGVTMGILGGLWRKRPCKPGRIRVQ